MLMSNFHLICFQARTLSVLGKRAVSELQNLVSVDFWESYDPEEVCNTGFGLIGSEPFHVRATCFLCGSAGREKVRPWYCICMCTYIYFNITHSGMSPCLK
jgi:histone-lysine N-methyltransferase MLL1